MAHRTIELTDEERVVARGTGEIHWFVRVNDGWVAAAKVPGALSAMGESRGSGVIWRRHTRLELEPGTQVLKIESVPLVLERTPLQHLTKSRSSPRRTRRLVYSVSDRGELVLVPQETGSSS